MTIDEAIDYYYAKGQRDYPDNFNPPGGNDILHDLGDIIGGVSDYEIACRKAYEDGWSHAKEQAGD